MFEKFKANILFNKLLQRPDINKAYAMVPETDAWYATIKKVHKSLDEISKKPHETIEITSHDNLKLKGIYYPGNSDVTVICTHGYTSHAEREWAFPGLFYLSLGYNVLIPYQRAHGISEGQYITFGALEQQDMRGWVNKVNEMNPNGKIILHGLSMGGGILLFLSDKEMDNVKCLVVDAPNVSIENVFKDISTQIFKSGADKVAAFASKRFEKEFGCDIKKFEALDIIVNGKYPILLSAGSEENMEELFGKIKEANPKDTAQIILPGCNHGNGMYKQTKMYQEAIKEFVEKWV